MKPLASAPPEKIHNARSALDAAMAEVADLHALMPDDCRAQVALPRRSFGLALPEDLQKAFWMELQMRSAPAFFMLLIAFLLDFLPIAIRRAYRPRRSLAEKIRAARLASRQVWSALSAPLAQDHISLRLEVEDYHELDVEVTFAAGGGAGPYLEDLKRHFEIVERAVSEISGEEMKVAQALSSNEERLSADDPLLAQLGEDRAIRLRLECAAAGARS
jgi:hypothetical protein